MTNDDLINKINNAANLIATQSRTGSGNYMVCNQYIMEKILGYDKVYQRKEKLKKLMSNIDENDKS